MIVGEIVFHFTLFTVNTFTLSLIKRPLPQQFILTRLEIKFNENLEVAHEMLTLSVRT